MSFLFKKEKLPNKILITGKEGIGKTTFANHLINYIFSINEDFKYNYKEKIINTSNKSFKMIKNHVHPNYFKISVSEGKKNIEIEQIREMIKFVNKSSFNNYKRIILIENVEMLNQFSSNALLKSLEEPNNGIIFILLHNNQKKCLETIKSRCIEYRIFLNKKYSAEIVDYYFEENIFNQISSVFKNFYVSPSSIIKLVIFCNEQKLNYENLSINELLKFYFENTIYVKNSIINDDIKYYLELFFYNKIKSFRNIDIVEMYNYFNKKFNFINQFNLDKESFFIEFNNKVFK